MTKRKRVAIATDSTAFLPPDLLAEYDIHVIPLVLLWEGESLLDNVDITPDDFYKRLSHARELPTTSQPSLGQFLTFFKEIAQEAESIVGCFISAELSATVDRATAAAAEMPDIPIEIVDSRSASMGLGYVTLAAARAIADGADYQQAAQAARAVVPKIRLMFVVDTLEFLHRGGRIGGAQRLLGSVLSIKPLLHLENGRIEPLDKVRTKRKAVERMLEIAATEAVAGDGLHAAVVDASVPAESARVLHEFQARLQPEEIYRAELSPVIGTHVGPGTVGLCFYND
jgi:DegV family protein with EDD domain